MQSVKFWVSLAVVMIFAASCAERSIEIFTEVPEETAPQTVSPELNATVSPSKQASNFRYDEKVWNLGKKKSGRSPATRSR